MYKKTPRIHMKVQRYFLNYIGDIYNRCHFRSLIKDRSNWQYRRIIGISLCRLRRIAAIEREREIGARVTLWQMLITRCWHHFRTRKYSCCHVCDRAVVVPLITRTLRFCGEHLINITVWRASNLNQTVALLVCMQIIRPNRRIPLPLCHLIGGSIESLLFDTILQLRIERRSKRAISDYEAR